MYRWYNISLNHVLVIVREVCRSWFCNDLVMKIDFYAEALQSQARMSQISNDFASSSDGILNACIGALDGWLVKMHVPT